MTPSATKRCVHQMLDRRALFNARLMIKGARKEGMSARWRRRVLNSTVTCLRCDAQLSRREPTYAQQAGEIPRFVVVLIVGSLLELSALRLRTSVEMVFVLLFFTNPEYEADTSADNAE